MHLRFHLLKRIPCTKCFFLYLHGHHRHPRRKCYHPDQELQHATKFNKTHLTESAKEQKKNKKLSTFDIVLSLTASSMVARQPCIEDKPYLSLSFSPSSENLSVLGELRYIPISFLQKQVMNQETILDTIIKSKDNNF